MTTSGLVKQLCVECNITISELARRIGQSRQNLCKKFQRDTLNLAELKQIADALGVKFDYYCDVTDYLSALKKIMADGGYTGETFANTIKALSGAEVEVVKRNELHTFAVLPKRWIVERSFATGASVSSFSGALAERHRCGLVRA